MITHGEELPEVVVITVDETVEIETKNSFSCGLWKQNKLFH
jgi:hypothetical protein